MIAIPILPQIRSLVVGAPGYFEGRKRPMVPADLLQHRYIRARMASGRLYRWEFGHRRDSMLIDAPGTLTLGRSRVTRAALCWTLHWPGPASPILQSMPLPNMSRLGA
jgi:hypothetical protein